MTQANATLPCDAEPIHVPGAIQPHGVLVALDPQTLEITQISANSATLFGVAPSQVLGRTLEALIGGSGDSLLTALALNNLTSGETLFAEVNGSTFDVRAHRHEGIAIVEFERQAEPARRAPTSDAMLRAALSRLQRPDGLREVCSVVVEEVRKLTGFDRVLLYQFDEEGHGDVIEEDRVDDVDAYWGHRFPASDIPRQARELYVLNWLRLIPNASYVPVPLLPEQRPDGGGPLDLSFSTLRSVSPIHLEYLRNMGVQASMSVSLVRNGKLWGLIACHHRSPRHVSFAARAACEVIARVASLQIAALEEIESRVFRRARSGDEAKLVDAMRNTQDEPARALLQRADALLALVDASGAAVCSPTGVRTVGATPSATQIEALLVWLAKEGCAGVLYTDRLSERHPPAAEYASVASGLLAFSVPGAASSYVLWFRPELVRTVSWAGNPAKAVVTGEGEARFHPRHSFETWKQVLRARAHAWRHEEIDAVEDLRRRVLEVDLVRQFARAEQAVRDRDETVAILSHDLKTPLQVIQLASTVLRHEALGDPRAISMIDRVERAVQRMNGLIHDLLDLAKIEAGRFEVTRSTCLASRLVSDVFTILAPLAEAKGVRLAWSGEASVNADSDRIFQALSNLVGNAIKFTPSGGQVMVQVEHSVDHVVRFAIVDNGPGIAAVELGHIFDRYWHSRRGRGAGTGLGLYIAKGIVEAHGGRIWVESIAGEGAKFYFTLLAPPLERAPADGDPAGPALH